MELLQQIPISNLSKYCRTCLKTSDYEAHEVDSLPKPIFHLFKQCVPYKKSHKKFPNLVCAQCFEALSTFVEFRSTASRSTRFLEHVWRTRDVSSNSEEVDTYSVQQYVTAEIDISPVSKNTIEPVVEVEEETTRNRNVELKEQSEQVLNFEEIFIKTEDEVCENEQSDLTNLDDDECRKVKRKDKAKSDEDDLSRNRLYICAHCGRSYHYSIYLSRHLTEAHNIKGVPTVCPLESCKKTFQHLEIAEQHYRIKHEQPAKKCTPKDVSCVCEDCGLKFKNIHKLRGHRFQHEPIEARPFHCKECDKRFTTKRYYNEHQLRHAGIRNFECPYCDMKKTNASELRAHINYHTKEKQYPCPLCPRVFNSAANLNIHDKVVHKGIRRFNCRYCDQSFGKPYTLKYHEMRHTGEKPHKCILCQKSFVQPSALKTHMKIHTKKGKMNDKI